MPGLDANRRLLVLGAGRQQLGLLAAAERRGLLVIAVDRDPAAPGFRFAGRRALISFEDEPAIHRLAEAERIDGVISPANDWSVGIAARVAHRLGLPHPLDPQTAALAGSWLRQRERFSETGVPHDSWLGDGPEVTVQAFSFAGAFHALSGPPGLAGLAARLGSPAEVELVREATGIDLNAFALKSALGERIDRSELVAGRLAA